MAQGRALTPQEKRERVEAKLAEQAQPQQQVREEHQRANTEDGRRRRGVFNGTTSKLSIGRTIPGYHLHWINDYPGRITQALENGYEFVKPEEVNGTVGQNTDLSGEKLRHIVGTDDSGNALYAYLMKIRQDWYDEDQAAIQHRNDIVDDAIRNGKNSQDTTGFYVPREGIKVTNK